MNSAISRRRLMGGIAALPFTPYLARAQANEPIRIGVLAPLTGGGGPYGADIVKASKLAADQINAAGGVLGGRKIELFVEDDETSATAAVKAARKLLDIDKVIAITAVWGSGPILAVRPLTLEKNVVLTALGSADEVTEGDTKGLVWRFQARASSWGEPAALAAGARVGVKVWSRRRLDVYFASPPPVWQPDAQVGLACGSSLPA